LEKERLERERERKEALAELKRVSELAYQIVDDGKRNAAVQWLQEKRRQANSETTATLSLIKDEKALLSTIPQREFKKPPTRKK